MNGYPGKWEDPIELGNIKIWRVVDTETEGIPPEEILPGTDPESIEINKNWLIPFYLTGQNQLIMANQSFLVQVDGMLILIDGAAGNTGKGKPRVTEWADRLVTGYLENLSKTGFQPEDIDIVFTTHFHMDHVGWLTKLENGKWVPTFKNARYLFVKAEYDYWHSLPANSLMDVLYGFVDSVLPVMESGQGKLVPSDYRISGSIYLEPAFGHTPGHTIINMESESTKIIFAGDILHHPLQVAEPHCCARYFDVDIERALQVRLDFLKKYADTGALVIPVHFANWPAGYIRHVDGKMIFEPYGLNRR